VEGVLDYIDPTLTKEVLDGPYLMAARGGGYLGKKEQIKTDTQVGQFARASSHKYKVG
jgi:hypothetical protein